MQPIEFVALSSFQDYPGNTACYSFLNEFYNIIDRLAVVQKTDWIKWVFFSFAFDNALNIFVKNLKSIIGRAHLLRKNQFESCRKRHQGSASRKVPVINIATEKDSPRSVFKQ